MYNIIVFNNNYRDCGIIARACKREGGLLCTLLICLDRALIQ